MFSREETDPELKTINPRIYLTMTGFSEPATKPKPSSWWRSSVTSRGSGTSSASAAPHFRGSSYVEVLLMWLKQRRLKI